MKINDEGEFMSIVIVGGNECMERQYKDICKDYGCRAKIFARYNSRMNEQMGSPDLLILFTSTVSHKMVRIALSEAKKSNSAVARSHSSSASALHKILSEYCA